MHPNTNVKVIRYFSVPHFQPICIFGFSLTSLIGRWNLNNLLNDQKQKRILIIEYLLFYLQFWQLYLILLYCCIVLVKFVLFYIGKLKFEAIGLPYFVVQT